MADTFKTYKAVYHRTYFDNTWPLTAKQHAALDNLDATDDDFLKFTYIMRMLDIVVTDRPERYRYYLDEDLYQCIQATKAAGGLKGWVMPAICNEVTLLANRLQILDLICEQYNNSQINTVSSAGGGATCNIS